MKKRLHVYYKGDVQGVGFRFAAVRTAESLGLTGWVKNLSDGQVEAICEGDEADCAEFLKRIAEIFGNYINDRDVEWSETTGEFDTFDIRW